MDSTNTNQQSINILLVNSNVREHERDLKLKKTCLFLEHYLRLIRLSCQTNL